MPFTEAIMTPRPPGHVILIRYVLFVIVAGVLNLATQELVYRMMPVLALAVSILAGTAVGFVVKYLLDKRFIFDDPYSGRRNEGRKVAIYGFFSIGTTVIFWGTELMFLFLFGTTTAKYAGGALGLALGNLVKYHLDRRFVFVGSRS